MSKIMSSASTRLRVLRRRRACRPRRPCRRRRPTGIGTAAPRASIITAISFASGARSASHSDLPDGQARGEHEGVGDAAADDELVDLGGEGLQDGELGGDLRAGDDRHQRALRVRERAAQGVQLGGQQRPGAGDLRELRDAVGGGLGAVRGAEGVVGVHVAQRGHPARERLVVLLLALVEAAVLEQHDLAGLHVDAVHPVAHAAARRGRAARPGAWPRGPASRPRENSPSLGRPRCEVTITAAPLSSAMRMPGTEARMRVSSVIEPSSACGTLRSARMKTRLPARSRSASLRTFMRRTFAYLAAMRATVVSSMRFEKPHSLSYQLRHLHEAAGDLGERGVEGARRPGRG